MLLLPDYAMRVAAIQRHYFALWHNGHILIRATLMLFRRASAMLARYAAAAAFATQRR